MSFQVGTQPTPVQVNGVLKNYGPGTVYYRDESPVTSTVNDGSVASGSQVTLEGTQWITCAAGAAAQVDVVPRPPRSSLIMTVGSRFDAAAAGTYSLGYALLSGVLTGAAGSSGLIYLDPADWSGGLTALRTRLVVATNTAIPVADFTAGLYPVTAAAGAAATVPVTPGTVITGSTAAVLAPATVTLNTAVSDDFPVPPAGFYAVGLVISASMAANSAVYARIELFARGT